MLNQKDLQEIQKLLMPLVSKITQIEQKIDGIEENIKHLPTKDEFYQQMDKLYGEQETIRQTQDLQVGYKDTLEDHETRISELEGQLPVAA